MKRTKFFKLLLILTIPLIIGLKGHVQSSEGKKSSKGVLTINVIGKGRDSGTLQVSLYDSPETFRKKAFKRASIQMLNGKAEWALRDIPYGEYAAAAYLDKNENKKLDKGFMGIPKERYGFSNKAKSSSGPPKYKAAKFQYSSTNSQVDIKLH